MRWPCCPVEDFENPTVRFLVGASRGEMRLLLVLFYLSFAILIVASLAYGVGWAESDGWPGSGHCTAPSYAIMLNPFLYLPYALTGNSACIPMGHPGQNLLEFLGYTSTLFAWSVAWWLFLSYALSRISVGAVGRFSRNRQDLGRKRNA